MIYNITDFECVAYRRRGFLVPNIHSVPEKPIFSTEFPFRTPGACFLHRVLQKTRRVHQEPLSCTARPFGTPEGPLLYRISQMPEKRRALPALNTTNARKEEPHYTARSSERLSGQENHLPKHLSTSRKLPDALRQHQRLPETPRHPLRQLQPPVRDKMSLFVFWQMF